MKRPWILPLQKQRTQSQVRCPIRRLDLTAAYQKPPTSSPHAEHVIYLYLLRDLTIDRPDQVSYADITWSLMRRSRPHLVVVMDWVTRKVLS